MLPYSSQGAGLGFGSSELSDVTISSGQVYIKQSGVTRTQLCVMQVVQSPQAALTKDHNVLLDAAETLDMMPCLFSICCWLLP
jgi:hypothetical protein